MSTPASPLLPRALATEQGVYGIILVTAVIASAGGQGAAHALLVVGVTLAVFWAAHVYAGTVAEHGTLDGEVVGLRTAMGRSVVRSRGLVLAGAIPAIPLVLGTLGLLRDTPAIWASLWVAVALLGILGYAAYNRKRAPLYMRIIGAVCTASFGVVIIIAKALIQH